MRYSKNETWPCSFFLTARNNTSWPLLFTRVCVARVDYRKAALLFFLGLGFPLTYAPNTVLLSKNVSSHIPVQLTSDFDINILNAYTFPCLVRNAVGCGGKNKGKRKTYSWIWCIQFDVGPILPRRFRSRFPQIGQRTTTWHIFCLESVPFIAFFFKLKWPVLFV